MSAQANFLRSTLAWLALLSALAPGAARGEDRPPAPRIAPRAEAQRAPEARRIEALRKLQKKIDREQRAVREVQAARAGAIETLQELEGRLAGEEEAMLRTERAAQTAGRELEGVEGRIAGLEGERLDLEARVRERLVALYKFGRVGYVRILLSSNDYQDFARRSRFLGRIVASDAQLIADYRNKLVALRAERGRVDAGRRELEDLSRAAAARREAVNARRGEKVALVAKLRAEEAEREEGLRDLERSASELQGVFFQLQEADRDGESEPSPEDFAGSHGGSSAFSHLKGSLDRPAEGSIVKRFGLVTDPELGTRIRSNGITLRAPYGAPIRAVADGRVLYAGWFRGYGRILIVDHGEGYFTLMAHASELLKQVGDRVRAGEAVARVGDSGSLEGPILYFEIRKEGKPLDPAEWIGS